MLIAGFPLLFVIPALVVAIALSLKHRQHWPFRFLGAMTVLAVGIVPIVAPRLVRRARRVMAGIVE